jgi:hypothetical protein
MHAVLIGEYDEMFLSDGLSACADPEKRPSITLITNFCVNTKDQMMLTKSFTFAKFQMGRFMQEIWNPLEAELKSADSTREEDDSGSDDIDIGGGEDDEAAADPYNRTTGPFSGPGVTLRSFNFGGVREASVTLVRTVCAYVCICLTHVFVSSMWSSMLCT